MNRAETYQGQKRMFLELVGQLDRVYHGVLVRGRFKNGSFDVEINAYRVAAPKTIRDPRCLLTAHGDFIEVYDSLMDQDIAAIRDAVCSLGEKLHYSVSRCTERLDHLTYLFTPDLRYWNDGRLPQGG